jgi:hypothetical protein
LTPRFSRQDARLVSVSRLPRHSIGATGSAPRAARSRKAGSFIDPIATSAESPPTSSLDKAYFTTRRFVGAIAAGAVGEMVNVSGCRSPRPYCAPGTIRRAASKNLRSSTQNARWQIYGSLGFQKGPVEKSKGTSHLIKRWKGASTEKVLISRSVPIRWPVVLAVRCDPPGLPLTKISLAGTIGRPRLGVTCVARYAVCLIFVSR